MTPKVNLSDVDLQRLIDAVVSVGDWLLAEQSRVRLVKVKSNATPLTNADQEADARLRAVLQAATPTVPILSEEGEVPEYSVRKGWDCFWLVDPLDGTKEYMSGRPDFTVNVALVTGQQPILGIVYAPGSGELYWGSEGGSFMKKNGKTKRIFSQPLSSKGNSVVILESRSHPSKETEEYLTRFQVAGRIQMGSSLKICRVAAGEGDLYPRLGPTMEWDTAAADAVYRFSGGAHPRYSPLKYNKPDMHNPHFVIGVGPEEQP